MIPQEGVPGGKPKPSMSRPASCIIAPTNSQSEEDYYWQA